MRIGIIGSGVVGQALTRGFTRHGHDVRTGTRDGARPELADFVTGLPPDVAAWADVVFLAVHGEVAVDVASSLVASTADKVVIDTTNPLDFSGGGPGMFVGITDSLGERVQRALPGARVVKAYNTVRNAQMVDPDLPGGPPTMLIAGDNDDAKGVVSDLLESTGWEVVDLGDVTASRWLEAFALVWIVYGVRTGTWNHAFRLLRPS